MAMGQKGEADVLLVHSPAAEKKFVAEGYGVNRRLVMHNDYHRRGTGGRSGQDQGDESRRRSIQKDRFGRAVFLSRGTIRDPFQREGHVWKAAGINPEGQKWYQQTGLGMGQTLNVASEKKGYTLADRGTYLALKKNLGLDILTGGRCHPAQYLPRHRGQPGQMAQGQCRREQGLC